jgi:hypothetical protein
MIKLIVYNFNVFIINVKTLYVKNVYKFIKKKINVVLRININVLYVNNINKYNLPFDPLVYYFFSLPWLIH